MTPAATALTVLAVVLVAVRGMLKLSRHTRKSRVRVIPDEQSFGTRTIRLCGPLETTKGDD